MSTSYTTMMFKTPVRFLIAAPSQSGKTTFVVNIIKNKEKLFCGQIENIVYICSNRSFVPNDLLTVNNLEIFEEMPQIEDIKPNTLLVIDDQQLSSLKDICALFCVNSHHRNISIFFLVQNLFYSNPYMRTISLNASHIVLFKSLRDKNQVQYLARQIFPDFVNSFMNVYKEETDKPYNYLVIDLSQTCTPICRIKTDIFSGKYFKSYALSKDINKYCTIEPNSHSTSSLSSCTNFLL